MDDLHIAAGILLYKRKLLTVRTADHKTFISAGGSIEDGETKAQAVIRELKEELDVDVRIDDLEFYRTIREEAATQPGRYVVMELFRVVRWTGDPTPSNEVTELFWADSNNYKSVNFGSIFGKYIIPELKEADLIN